MYSGASFILGGPSLKKKELGPFWCQKPLHSRVSDTEKLCKVVLDRRGISFLDVQIQESN